MYLFMSVTHNGMSHVTTIPEFEVWWNQHIRNSVF